MAALWRIVWGFALSSVVFGQPYSPPAGIRPARRGSAISILPGGRIIAPAGEQFLTGPGPSGLALSASGNVLVTTNAGPPARSLTVLERGQKWDVHEFPWERAESDRENPTLATPIGVAFSRGHLAFVSEGRSGRLALMDVASGERRSALDLNRSGYHDSFTGDLALDTFRNILYVADWANSRVVAIDARLGPIDAKPRGILASIALGGRPLALALSPDRKNVYIIEPESESVSVIDVSEPAAAKVDAVLRVGKGATGVVATAQRVYVSNTEDDSITVIDRAANRVETEIPIRVPGLAQLRGVAPAGLAYDEKTGWLLVAEPGINAVAVIDTHSATLLGHIPAGWAPTRVLIDRGTVYVVNQRGQGAGPSAAAGEGGSGGSVSMFPLPPLAELAGDTEFVMRAAGFVPSLRNTPWLPPQIRHVVLIEKAGGAFDEILGDIRHAANGPVAGAPALARFGRAGFIDGHHQRLSLHDVNVTPNHHAIAERWAFSDNFYADPEGSKPWDYLGRNGASVLIPDEAVAPSDTERVDRLIHLMNDRYIKTGADLPQLLYIRLQNDGLGKPRPADGYPYEESFVVENDYALGRILEFLSGTPWWSSMAVFITGDSLQGGVDHIDAHRTLLLCAGPWAKRNYVSHINSSPAGLWKTVFEILKVPPMSLLDASAADLSDCLAASADVSAYQAAPVDKRVYDPGAK